MNCTVCGLYHDRAIKRKTMGQKGRVSSLGPASACLYGRGTTWKTSEPQEAQITARGPGGRDPPGKRGPEHCSARPRVKKPSWTSGPVEPLDDPSPCIWPSKRPYARSTRLKLANPQEWGDNAQLLSEPLRFRGSQRGSHLVEGEPLGGGG